MPAYDYAAVADIYDDFCVFDGDIDYLREITATAEGPVLELMAGTGRVSLPLVRAGVALTCIDHSAAMLNVLRHKLRHSRLHADLVCGDVCDLPLGSLFSMVILPFQGFTELVGHNRQARLFHEVSRLLPQGGRFVCTSHNPTMRARDIDGSWHEMGRFHHEADRELVLSLRTVFSKRPGVVEGTQKIEVIDPSGRLVESRSVALEFSLTSAATIVRLATAAGLAVSRLLGDYRGNRYDESSSPCLVVELQKAEV